METNTNSPNVAKFMATQEQANSGAVLQVEGVPPPVIGRWIFFLTVIGFAGVTLWLAWTLNLYIDEAYSLHTTDAGLHFALVQSIVFEQQPPLYFLLLALWRSINHSVFFGRLTSVACVIAMLFVVRNFAHTYIRNMPNWAAPLLIAINPFTLWAAIELRVYALILLLSALLLSSFFRAFVDSAPKRRDVLAFTCFAILAMYTQYFFIATLVGLGLVVIFFQRTRLLSYLIAMVAVIAALLPMISIVRRQAHDASVETLLNPRGLAEQMGSTVASFVLPHVWIATLDSREISFAYIAIFSMMTILAAIGIQRSHRVVELAIVSTVVTVFFLTIILVLHDPIEMPRHITSLFIPLILTTIAAIASSFGAPKRRSVLGLYLAIFAVCALAEDAHTYRPMAKLGDWIRVSHYLETSAQPSEPIAVFDAENALPIAYTYVGPNAVVPIPHKQHFDSFRRADFAIENVGELEATFPKPSPVTHVVWLVVQSPCRYIQLGNSCTLLQHFIRAHFYTLTSARFYNSAVYKLRAK